MRTVWLLYICLLCGCAPGHLTRQEIYDPANCVDCHETHVNEWQMSMHAYASDDPLFLAMDRKRQDETGGELAGFCIQCHAPLAVALEGIESAEELEDLPDHLKGITCAFCHLAEETDETHNNPLTLAGGRTLRAAIRDPVRSPAHPAGYGAQLDRRQSEASQLCGSCHDIVLPNDLHLERTFEEWQSSLFGQVPEGSNNPVLGCGGCHMLSSDRPIADFDGVGVREAHDHSMPGVDVPLTAWPNRPEIEAAVQDFLGDAVRSEICVNSQPPGVELVVGLENVAAGHSFPSGSTQDRRIWGSIQVWDGDELLWERGAVAEGEPATEQDQLILLRDTMLGADGQEVHDFWAAESLETIAPQNGKGLLLALDPQGREQVRIWSANVPTFGRTPTRVSLRMFVRPVGFDVMNELVETGYLDPDVPSEMPTFELTGARLDWDTGQLGTCVRSDNVLER